MRLKRLDLTRFGMFTDYSIDFGDPPEGRPDLHLVYGPNEAGKSTALAAYLDFLYGIRQTRYNFQHPDATMRIGGLLAIAGQIQEFTRIKRPANSLLNVHGQPIADAAILSELGGIDRDAYSSMFSLDDDTLEQGGRDILESKGDLGQLLFSASSGWAELSRRLVDVKSGTEGFYKFRAHRTQLTQLKDRLTALKSEREAVDTQASKYAELSEKRERCAQQYDDEQSRRGKTQIRLEELQRHLMALPRIRTLHDIRAELAPLAAVSEAPAGWTAKLADLLKEQVSLKVRIENHEKKIEEQDGIVARAEVDEPALALADRMERLSMLRARYLTAEPDIPRLRTEEEGVDLAMRQMLSRVGLEAEADPSRLVLRASLVERLRSLIEERAGIDTGVEQAARELQEAEQALRDGNAALQEKGGTEATTRERASLFAAVAAAHGAARTADHAGRCRTAKRKHGKAMADLAEQLALLLPWKGNADELAAVEVPDVDRIQAWKSHLSELQRQIDRLTNELETVATDIQRLTAERDAVAATTGIVSDDEAAKLRAAREQAWADHRRSLAATSADFFETAMRLDDLAVAARITHVADLAKLHQAAQQLVLRQANQKRTTELHCKAISAQTALQAEIAAAVCAISRALPDSLALPQLEVWIEQRKVALQARRDVHDADEDLRATEAEARAARANLSGALERAGVVTGPAASLDELITAAQQVLDEEATVKELQEKAHQRRQDLTKRQRQAGEARGKDEAWTKAWAEACKMCWLGDSETTPPLSVVREALAALADLRSCLDKKAGVAHRITSMRDDQATFVREVEDLACALNIPVAEGAALEVAKAVVDRVQAATKASVERTNAEQALETARKEMREVQDDIRTFNEWKAKMTGHFGVETLEEVDSRLADLRRRKDLNKQLRETETEILEAVRLPTMADAEGLLDSLDRAALEQEERELKARSAYEDQRCREFFLELGRASDALQAIGADARVAEIEEKRRTVLMEIEDGALQYLRLRLGAAAMEQAFRIYRDRHRSSMMAQASEAFRLISRGAYSGLSTQPRKDGETLIAMSATGASKVADQLSKGTRFQLYLALRVAGYQEFAQARTPVPFICDDIMETFDDFRAEEAFRLFGKMAEVGQIIYLTHHRHLCDIANRVCPTVRIHNLPAAFAAA